MPTHKNATHHFSLKTMHQNGESKAMTGRGAVLGVKTPPKLTLKIIT